MKDMQAKYRYIQTVRGLKTYGITFFEGTIPNPNLKKPIPVWIGITKNGIMRVDPSTGETVKQWDLEQLRRWASDVDCCTLDFGNHESDYLVVTTTESSAISELIGGYIDIILRNRRDVDKVAESDDDEIGNEEMMSGLVGLGHYGITSSYDTPTSYGGFQAAPMNPGQQYSGMIPGNPGLHTQEEDLGKNLNQHIRGPDTPSSQINVVDMASSIKSLRLLESELGGARLPIDTTQLSPEEWAKLFKNIEDGINAKVQDLLMQAKMSPGKLNKADLDKKAADLAKDLQTFGNCARALVDLDPRNEPLFDGARAFAGTIADILDALLKGADQGSTGPEMAGTLEAAGKAWDANKLLMQNPDLANYIDEATKALILECIHDVEVNFDQMLDTVTTAANKAPPAKGAQLLKDVDKTGAIKGFPIGVLQNLTHAALDPEVKYLIIDTCGDLGQLATDFMQKVKMDGFPMSQLPSLYAHTEGIDTALFNLQQVLGMAEGRATARPDIRPPVHAIIQSLDGVKQSMREPAKVLESLKAIVQAQQELSGMEKMLMGGSPSPADIKLASGINEMNATLKELFQETKAYSANPRDLEGVKKTLGVVGKMEGQAQFLLNEADTLQALHNLRHHAKLASASALKIANASSTVSSSMNNPSIRADLLASAKHVQETMGDMLGALQNASLNPSDFVANSKLLELSRSQVPFYSQLSSTARGAATRAVPDANKKQQLSKAAQEAGDNVMKLHKAIQEVSDLTGITEIEKAMAEFDSTKADLETAAYLAKEGLLEKVPGQTRDNSQALLNMAADTIAKAVDDLVAAAKQSQRLPDHIKECAFGIGQIASAARTMATSVDDKDSQQRSIGSAKDLLDDTLSLIGLARELALDPTNVPKQQAIERKRRAYEASLGNLKGNTSSVDSSDVNQALGDIDREIANLTKNGARRVGYKDASDAVDSATKALGAAVMQMTASAKGSPNALGSASKMTAATVAQLLQICSDAATAAPDENTADGILAAARALADAMKALLNGSLQVAIHKTPQTLACLAEATEQVGISVDDLMDSLGTATSPETDKSLNRIMDTIRALESNSISANASTRDQLLNQFLACARDMARVTTNLVTSAHVSANKQGQYSKEASEIAKELIHLAKSSELSDGSIPTMTVEGAKVCKGSDWVINNVDNTSLSDKVKSITENGSKLINIAKETAKAEPDPKKRESIVRAAQNVVNQATTLATSSRNINNSPESKQKLVQCAAELKDSTLALEAAMRKEVSSDTIVNPAIAQQLTGTTKVLALATHDMIKASAAVATNSSNASAEFELKKSTDTVADSIKSLMEVCASMNPAIKQCDYTMQVIKDASLELDKASVAATMGTLEQDVGPSNAPFQEVQQKAHTNAQQLSKQVYDLVSASSSPQELKKSAQAISQTLPQLIDLIKMTAAASQDQTIQSKLLSASKQMVEDLSGMFKDLKSATTIDQQSTLKLERAEQRTQDSLASLLGELQSELQLQQEMDDAMRSMKASLAEISKPVSVNVSSYSEVREELSELTKDLVAILSILSNADVRNTGVVSLETSKLTELIPKMVGKVRLLIASTPDPQAKKKLVEAITHVTGGTVRSLNQVKAATQGQGNKDKLQQDVTITNAAITSLLSAAKQGAVGEAMMDKAIQMITQKIQTLNTASVFAQAGQLDENPQAASMTMSELESQLHNSGGKLSELSQKIEPATRGTDEVLGGVSTDLATALGNIINIAVALSSKLQDSMAQQEIISAAKLLAISNEQLILGARDLHKVLDDKTAKSSVESSQKAVLDHLKNLNAVVEQIGAAAARGLSEVNNAIAGIKALLQMTPGYATALPGDVAAAAEEVLVSASRVIFSPSQAETTEGAQACFTSVEDLLNTAKTLAENATDAFAGEQLTTSSRATAQFIINLLEITKLSQADPATQSKYEAVSGKISQAVNGVMAALRRFPGGQNIKLAGGQNFVQMAEAELLACAQIVEDVSKKLSGVKPMARVAKPKFGLVDVAEIAASILESSMACSKATSVLVQWAVAAHRERVKAAQASGQPIDPMSCQGIICASQSVSDSIQDLFVGSSQAAQGKGEEDKLIACANNVASSTSALVAASKVQALAESNTQQTLAKSAKAVAHSTAKLITAAQMLSMGDLGEVESGNGGELEHQIRILELEKQLEKEKNRAKKLKTERPVSVYLQGNRTSVYGLQPAGGKRVSIYGNRESVYGGRGAGNRSSMVIPSGGLQGLGGVRF
eukprot:TRINITY_DN4836_c0_g1_i1.p1 TRINITY_DN4836_c0_g1~~TRINITY_DN4836_c0_g1_i1.p1  ORF type:complete len:2520 (+),score=654.19 TRINITY_DN4836_c0_g1_i1:831-7562(+)